ncbi:MAG: YabP/YqfC family sporulation protein [Clostridia bacterium]|nr:YabP/YqfC family sporulation protein [Clostridia bacterium]
MPKEEQVKNKKEGFRFSPKDFLRSKCHIELTSNTSAMLEGSRGVLEYSTECIRVATQEFVVSFKGRGLTLICISPTALTIQGSIINIEYSD